ncbi:restriction endonuclease subunit S [Salmonella enterica]
MLDGVEVKWFHVGDVCEIKRGTPITKRNVTDGKIPVIAGGRTFAYFHNVSNRVGETIVIAGSGAYAGFVSWWEKPIFVSDAFTVKPCDRLLSKYCFYWFQRIQGELYALKTGGGIPHIYPRDISPIKIPIPCPDNPEKSLAIQSEIVRILDTFTALTNELTNELKLRRQQYNYYREQLLSFKEGEVEWKRLGEIAEYSKTRISFEQLDETNYVGVDNLLQNCEGKTQSNYVPKSGNFTEFREKDILIGNIRPYLRKIWQADCAGGTNGDVLVIRCNNNSISVRYLYQVLADGNFFEYNMKYAKGAKMPRGSKEAILKYRIPIPPFNEQIRIITILDKFDTLTNSISEGLPLEIELRKKQYEHYRDLLFSFPKPVNADS